MRWELPVTHEVAAGGRAGDGEESDRVVLLGHPAIAFRSQQTRNGAVDDFGESFGVEGRPSSIDERVDRALDRVG